MLYLNVFRKHCGNPGTATLAKPERHFIHFTLRWKNSQSEGLRAEMSYCRKHFLNRTALLTIEV